MKRNIHEAIHKVFSNDLPVEQYARLVELNSTIHTKEFMQAICEVLSRQPEDIYREHVIDRRGNYIDKIYLLSDPDVY